MSAVAGKTNGRVRGPRVPLAVTPPPAPEPERVESRPTKSLDAAVLAVQASASKLIRNAIGQTGPRTYGYVTLDAVVDEVLPLCVEHDLLWRTFPTILEGEPALRYRMTHIPSGEFDEDVMSLMIAKPDPQGQGSALTYARRYALTAYLNLTVDADDDGAAASAPAAARSQSTSQQPTAAAPKRQSGGRPASEKQQGMLRAKAKAAKLSDSQLADVILVATGNEPRTMAEEAAARWLGMGLERLPAKHVNAAVAWIAHTSAEGSQA